MVCLRAMLLPFLHQCVRSALCVLGDGGQRDWMRLMVIGWSIPQQTRQRDRCSQQELVHELLSRGHVWL